MKTNVNVRIMENDYQLLCDIEEKELLTRGAEVLSKNLKEFRKNNPSIDNEKLLIMGALRTTCELVSELNTLEDQVKITNDEVKKLLSSLST